MEYRPKHPQPFSFSDALKFDPATITEGSAFTSLLFGCCLADSMDQCPLFADLSPFLEISRLQNSLQHLKRTQNELSPHSGDPELAQALRENEAVMSVCPTFPSVTQ
jgi:hypothetical protein